MEEKKRVGHCIKVSLSELSYTMNAFLRKGSNKN